MLARRETEAIQIISVWCAQPAVVEISLETIKQDDEDLVQVWGLQEAVWEGKKRHVGGIWLGTIQGKRGNREVETREWHSEEKDCSSLKIIQQHFQGNWRQRAPTIREFS